MWKRGGRRGQEREGKREEKNNREVTDKIRECEYTKIGWIESLESRGKG